MRFLLLALVAVFVQGCASTKPINFDNLLSNAPDCCQTIKEIPRTSVKLGETRMFEITGVKGSHVVEFPWGRGLVLPLEIPNYEGRLQIQIKSVNRNNQLMYPMVSLFDEDWQELKQFQPDQFIYTNGAYRGTLFFNDLEQKAKYLLVYSPPDISDEEKMSRVVTPQIIPIVVPVGPVMVHFNYHTANESQHKIELTAGGRVFVTVESYKPQTMGSK